MRRELELYEGGLTDKPEIVALSQIDSLAPDIRAEKLAALEAEVGHRVVALSAVSREGLPETLRLLRRQIDSFADEDVERLAEEDASRFGHRMSEEDWRR